jgi:hypothetical protein
MIQTTRALNEEVEKIGDPGETAEHLESEVSEAIIL